MSEVIMVPDGGQRNNSTFDPNLLLTAMMNGGNGFGGNGNWMWVIFLFFLFPLLRNGGFWGNGNNDGGSSGLGSLGNLVNNDAGRELIMQAIQGNASAIQNLANMLNTSTSNIQQAICGVENSITQLSGQVGMSGQQIINSVQQGNMQLASSEHESYRDMARGRGGSGRYNEHDRYDDDELRDMVRDMARGGGRGHGRY